MGKLQRGERRKVKGERKRISFCLVPFAFRVSPFAFGLLFLAGCTSLNQTAGNDPLLGGPPLRTAGQGMPQPPSAAAALPPRAPNSTLNNATLAAGAPRPLNDSRDLRIGSSRGRAGNDGWAREGAGGKNQDSGMRLMAENNGVLLRPPEPATEPVVRRDTTPVSNPAPPGDSRIITFEQAQARIATRGVIWQRLEMVGENAEWKYSCSLPNRQNPRIRRTYEARAGDSVAAIRAVLEQIDKEQ